MSLDSFIEDNMLQCQFKEITGVDCPGCGFQRAVLLLLKGDFVGSFVMYPALLPFFVTFGLLFYQLIFKKEKGGLYIMYSFILSVLVMMVNLILNYLNYV